jgi:F0F1-type ATP synthase epsilon subunit
MIEEKSKGAEEQAEAKGTAAAKDAKPVDSKNLIATKIFAPFTVYFEGEAKSISAVNESGPFDVLAHHHNFITMLLPCNLVVHTPYDDKTFRITRGLMHVRDNKVIVFLDV